jgi:HK97 family phage major capsid protein
MTREALKMRAARLAEEAKAKDADVRAGRISNAEYKAFVERGTAESEEIQSDLKTYDAAARFSGAADLTQTVGQQMPGTEQGQIFSPSPMDMTATQLNGLMEAAKHRTPFSIELQPKSYRDSVQMKTAVTESGLGGSFTGNLPPVQTPFAVGIGYESTRISDLLPNMVMPGPSATWLSHTANGAEVAVVAEGGAKGDISPTISEQQIRPVKIAGLCSVSLEAWQDTDKYGEGQFASWLPTELTRSLINEESNLLLNSSSTFNGLLQVSGTLTRTMGTDSPLDCLAKSFADLRTGSAFADPDLILMHPATLGSIRRAKDADGRYLADLLAGPIGLTALGQHAVTAPAAEANPHSVIPQGSPAFSGGLWGAPIATTTQVAAGTAVVMSIRAGAAIVWRRLGLTVFFNPYSSMTSNIYTWIAEERIALSSPRPTAINIVTGLPTS